jgi:glycosyltransferase involved in cell wall biosynthesis
VERYRTIARRYGVADRVSFIGVQAETTPWYQAADMLVYPSLYEAFSLAGLEAAAAGLPIVGTAVHGIRELVGAEEGGLLVERTSPSLAAALERLGADPELRGRLGAGAQRRASAYTWERTATAFLDTVAEAEELRARERRERAGC